MASRHVLAFLVWAVLPGVAVGCGAEGEERGGSPSSGAGSSVGSPSGTGSAPAAGDVPDADSGTLTTTDSLPPIESPVFREVDRRARALAQTRYTEPEGRLPASLRDIGYDEYRSIRYRPGEAVWRGESPFEVQLFHPGYRYGSPVTIHLVEGDGIRELGFDTRRFRYEGDATPLADVAAPQAGYAGFRVHYPLNETESKDEVVVFLGASYFRLLGPGHVHGLSSRGLAVDTGLPEGEEFPDFREFWLVKPAPGEATLTFYALLDGPSVTGAYRFELRPGAPGPEERMAGGEERGGGNTGEVPTGGETWRLPDGALPTILDVEARLYARSDVAKLGVAPLTSMFLFDPNNAGSFDDFRSRVHDSHGLLALTASDEWIWRPLHNGPGLSVTQLRDTDPRGFGLVQRERSFESYLDLEARYDRRPSEWVEVGEGHWGTGGVELVEIPTESEFNDNIVAYWAPDAPFRAGDRRYYRYRLVTFDGRLPIQTLAQVERTRIGWEALPGESDPPPRSHRRFVVDFARARAVQESLPATAPLWSPDDSVAVFLSTSAGEVGATRLEPLPEDRGWRVTFRLRPEADRPSDMRLYLESDGRRLTETWSYVWHPEQAR